MVSSSLLLAAACAVSCASARFILPDVGSITKWTQPDFCHDKVCPRFANRTKDEPYEVREYDATTWASYDTSDGFVVSEGKAYTQLTRYFKGANVKDAHLDLTNPTATLFQPTDADFSGSKDNYTVSFFLPGRAPKPQVDGVYIAHYGAQTVYVRSFGGYGTEATILQEAKTLRDQLLHDKVDIEEHVFLFSTYDSPARLFARHNEVSFWAGEAHRKPRDAAQLKPRNAASVADAVTAATGLKPKDAIHAADAATRNFQAAAGQVVDSIYGKVKAFLG